MLYIPYIFIIYSLSVYFRSSTATHSSYESDIFNTLYVKFFRSEGKPVVHFSNDLICTETFSHPYRISSKCFAHSPHVVCGNVRASNPHCSHFSHMHILTDFLLSYLDYLIEHAIFSIGMRCC